MLLNHSNIMYCMQWATLNFPIQYTVHVHKFYCYMLISQYIYVVVPFQFFIEHGQMPTLYECKSLSYIKQKISLYSQILRQYPY